MIRRRAELEAKRKEYADSGVSTIEAVIAVAIGLAVLVVIFALIPMIGSSVDTSISIPPGSVWNTSDYSYGGVIVSNGTDLVTGVDLWQNNASLLSLAVAISILGLVIGTVMYFARQ